MRNILTLLTLFLLAFASTNAANADGYDESRRTERLGLSFYDGRPLYVAYIRVYPSTLGNPQEHSFELVRLRTGESLDEMANSYNPDADQGHFGKDGKYTIYGYYSVEADGRLKLLTDGSFKDYPESNPNHWLSQYLLNYKPGVSSGDIGVFVFDAISERSKPWLLPALGVALALFGVRYCYRLLVRMIQGESGVGLGGANESVSASRDDCGVSSDFVRPTAEARDNLEQVDVSSADEYATGAAFGREFTSKAVASNVDLQNEWSRLSASERAELLGDAFESDFGGSPFGGTYPRRNNDFYNLTDEENEE